MLLVLDGLSFAVWRPLSESLARHGWTEWTREGGQPPLIGASTLPSITEISRASLLCGTLVRGDQATERAGFARNRQLVAASAGGLPPLLFHKADLGSGPELPRAISDAILKSKQRIVGVVHNAVDAQLSGSDQIEQAWSVEVLRYLLPMLRLCRDVGRAVIVTADHGHVVESGTFYGPSGAGGRWRESGSVGEGEVALSGGRVLTPSGGDSLVGLWSERVRYGARHAGYHGGASPQEVLLPVAVMGAVSPPPGWREAPPAEPAWWNGHADGLARAPALEVAPVPAPISRRSDENRQSTLSLGPPVASHVRTSTGGSEPRWITALLTSEIYETQRRLAGGSAPDDASIRQLLRALEANDCRLSRAGLARALGIPLQRVAGVVAGACRLFNVSSTPALRLQDDWVVLEKHQLRGVVDLQSGE